MPLTNCPDCGHQCSPQAKACPKCGRPIAPFTPVQRAVAKNVAGLTSGCVLGIIGIAVLLLLPIEAPLIALAIVKAQENPFITILIIACGAALVITYIRKRK
jgi:uncharacterized membrane protein YvbJ